jgi:hypothetical protein
VAAEASRGVAALTRVEAILRNPETYALAAAVPTPPKSNGGRPRDHPDFMVFVYEALISVYGSARQVEAEFAHHLVWRLVQRHVAKRTGVRLPGAPMRRHHYLYLRSRYLTDPAVQEQLRELHRVHSAGHARQVGLLDPGGPGSWTHPHPTRSLHGDGKVITPLYRARPGDTRLDKQTGELIPKKYEPDGGLHFEGTGETAWGTKFVLIAARGPATRQRVILDAAFVAKPGGEAATATEAITHVAPQVPGAQAVIYDTALRGVHHQTLLRDLGLLPINRVSAAKAGAKKARRNQADQRQEKSTLIDTKTIDGQTVSLYAKGGAIGIAELDDTGTMTFTPLRRVRTHRNADKAGRYRWYNDYALPDHQGGGTVTVRLHGNDEDARRKLNRTENLRPIPPTDPDFPGLFRQRNDAESINRGLDDTLFLRRAHSVGQRRQWLNLLGYALTVNSLALLEHERRKQEPLAA